MVKLGRDLKKESDKFDWIIIFFIIFVFFLILEKIHPFYFLSDDNRVFYLPLFTHNFRAVSGGELPLFNFHQSLGIPHFSNLQSAIFYPLTYLSMLFSKLFSGHEFWTIDIAVFLHFFIGSFGFYKLIKFFTKDRFSALFGSIVWPLAAFSVFISNSWWILSGVISWFPWILLSGFTLLHNPTGKNLTILITFRLLLFYAGHIEYFIHCMIFEFLTILLLGSALNAKYLNSKFTKKYFFSYPITLIYSLPILLPAWFRMKASGMRSENFDFNILHTNAMNFGYWLNGLFNPFNLDPDFYLREQSKFSFGTFPHLSHIGFITILLVIFCVIYTTFSKKYQKQRLFEIAIFVLFLISLLWSFGLLAGLLYYIPILNRFRFPFKLLIFSNFYLIFVACFGFHFFTNLIRNLRMKRLTQYSLIILTLLNFYLFYSNVYISFNNKAHIDLIPLNETFSTDFRKGRVFSLAEPETEPFSARTLGFNYPTLFGLNHFAGYDPLIPKKNYDTCLNIKYRAFFEDADLPFDYLRKWGVDWYILNKDPIPGPRYYRYRNILEASSSFTVFAEEPKRTIFHDSNSAPLLHWKNTEADENIKYEMHTNYILISTNNSEDEYFVINYLFNDFFKAEMNDSTFIPIRESEIGQMEIFVPKGKNQIKIKYSNPYFRWGVFVVLFVSLFLILLWEFRRKGLLKK
jgi:hypothetical protein